MLDKDKKKIIALMKKDPEIKLSSVAEYTGLSLSSVKKIVAEMKSEKLLKNNGKTGKAFGHSIEK